MTNTDLVTGAFGYTGRYLSTRLLATGRTVRTLTDHPRDDVPLSGLVDVHRFDFTDPDALAASMAGVDCVYNTYWVRYAEAGSSHEVAVARTRMLLDAAARAGVRRFVQVSITNPDPNSFYAYYRGKASVEDAVKASGLSYAIVRPTVLFGDDDILINNIGWLVRRFPVFTVPGDGRYRLRPVATRDLAELMARVGAGDTDTTIDAVGPERWEFIDLVRAIARATGARCLVRPAPPALVQLPLGILARITGDVVLTMDEVHGLMAGLVDTDGPATCPTPLSEHLRVNAHRIGERYQSELARR